jgi:CubicO group peptidase (beta-lactamase class C family)
MSLERGPEDPGAPVTAYNWQDPPFNRWAFWHVGDVLPTYPVARGDGPARALPTSGPALDLLGAAVTRTDGSAGTAGEVLSDTFTDAYAVLQDGELVTEWYGPLGAPDRPHALMSVSKSVVGCVAAVLIDSGQLDPRAPVTAYVPELASSGYAGAMVRTCAAGSPSWRSTPTRKPTSGGWMSGSAGNQARTARRRASPAGCTAS